MSSQVRASMLLFGLIISLIIIVIEAFALSKLFNDVQPLELTWRNFNEMPNSIQYKLCPTWCRRDAILESFQLDALNEIGASNFITFKLASF